MKRFRISGDTWCALIAVAFAVAVFTPICICFDDVLSPAAEECGIDGRIGRAKAEKARIIEKYGKNGKLPLTAWVLRPEVALPLALALLEDEELAKLGIDRARQIALINADPNKFRVAVPGHWRKRFLLLTREQEKTFGDRTEREIEKDGKLYRDPAAEARVRRVAERLWKYLPEGTPHRIALVRDDTVNAFVIANGRIYVHSGLLVRISSDDTLAFVLAHEYAHYLARHANESVTKKLLDLAVRTLVADMQMRLENDGKVVRSILLMAGYAGGSYAGVHLPFSRRMEQEADTIGIRLMAQAGFAPEGAVVFFEQLTQGQSAPGWERFLSTHPTDAKRLERMRKECAELKRSAVARP